MSDDTAAVVRARFPRLTRSVRGWAAGWDRLGEQTAFYAKALVSIGDALRKYKAETLRVLAEMSLGVGALALIGGEVVILAVLTGSAAAIVGIFGYVQAGSLGVSAIAGFFSAYANVRLQLPLIVANGLAATIGAGATAQLGAMRINEEVDALEGMGVPSLPYLVTTRIVAGAIAVVPLYALGLISSYFGSRLVTVYFNGQSAGTYDHYFGLFLSPVDVLWSFLKVVLFSVVIILIHCYYGYRASGGPAGVGVAVGRAVRTAIVMINIFDFFMSLAIWGATTTVRIAP